MPEKSEKTEMTSKGGATSTPAAAGTTEVTNKSTGGSTEATNKSTGSSTEATNKSTGGSTEATNKSTGGSTEATNKPEVRRRGEWFEFPDLFRWDFPDVMRWFDRSLFEGRMRIEEETRDDALVIRAEMPGIDPDKDVELTVADGVLHMTASRRKESREQEDGRFRSEFRYGSFTRSIPLPKGASAQDVQAVYRDGILEVTIPVSRAATDKQKVAIARG